MTGLLGALQAHVKQLETLVDDPAIHWKPLILRLLVGVYLFETYVSYRQYKLYSRPAPPAELASHVDLKTYEKSAAYGRDKAKYTFVKQAADLAMMAAAVHYNVYARVWNVSGQAGDAYLPHRFRNSEVSWPGLVSHIHYRASFSLPATRTKAVHSILWTIGMFAIREIPMQPFAIYRNFVLEEKHGFNKMTPATYVKDTLTEWVLGLVIGGPLIAGVVAVIRWAGDAFVTYIVAFLLGFQIIALVLYPTLIQPLFNKLTPLPEGALRDRVFALAASLDFPLKHIYVIDGSKRSAHSNAYFYGFLPGGNKHIVIFDTLIEKSSHDEIEAVLAHELGHWKHRDTAKLLVIGQAQIFLQMSIFALFIHNRSLFSAFGFQQGGAARKFAADLFGSHSATVITPYLPVVVGLELFQLVVNPLDAVLKFVLNAAVRSMEYAADSFAANLPRPPPTEAEVKAAEAYNSPEAVAERKAQEEQEAAAAAEAVGAAPNGDGDNNGVPPAAKVPDFKADPFQQEAYSVLLKRSLIKLGVQNLSSMHNDPLYSAYHHSHPTLAERLRAITKIEGMLKKDD